MADYDNPRPSSQPVGSTDPAVVKDDLITLDRIVTSTSTTETNRKGGVRKTLLGLEADAQDAFRLGAGDSQGDYVGGVSVYEESNWTFTYNGQQWGLSGDFDLSNLPYLTTEADPNNDENLAVRGSASQEYVQTEITRGQNEVVNGNIFPLDDDVLADGMTVPVGTTHLRVLVGGEPAIVAMSPIASGSVNSLTESGATIGGSPVQFNKVYYEELNADRFIKSTYFTSESSSYPSSNYSGEFIQIIPRTIPSLSIFRDVDKKFHYNINVGKFVGSGANKLFISSYGSGSGDGLTPSQAKTWSQFSSEVLGGTYDNTGSIYLYLLDDVYYLDDSIGNLASIPGTRVYIENACAGGECWLTNAPKLTWSNPSSGRFTANMGAEIGCSVIDLNYRDGNGIPIALEPVDSIANLVPGSFFYESGTTTIHVQVANVSTGAEDSILVSTDSAKFGFFGGDSRVLVDGISFFTGGVTVSPINNEVQVFKECVFVGGGNDSLAAQANELSMALLGCKGAWSGKDIYNYHSLLSNAADTSVIVEVNCIGYNAGVYKYENYTGANTNTASNNGSTAHEGMTIFRFGCKYWNCQGPVVADIQGCRSVCYGLNVGDIADGSTGTPRNMLFSGAGAGAFSPSETVLVDCKTDIGQNATRPVEANTTTFIFDNIDMPDYAQLKIDSANVEYLV